MLKRRGYQMYGFDMDIVHPFEIKIVSGIMFFIFHDNDGAETINETCGYNARTACCNGYHNALEIS